MYHPPVSIPLGPLTVPTVTRHVASYPVKLVQGRNEAAQLLRRELDGHLLRGPVDVAEGQGQQERRLPQRREAAAGPSELEKSKQSTW